MRKSFLKTLATGAIAVAALGCGAFAVAAETGIKLPEKHWHFQGPFGTYDRAAAQRGYQIYKEVCSACHSLSLLSYRNLMELGLTENQVKGLIAEIQVPDLGDDGAAIDRPARLSDRFKKPFANELAAAAANGGKAPPDLSVIIKAREDGPNYVHALMMGYVPFDKLTPEQIKEAAVTKDDNYNKYFPGHRIAMPPPLGDDKVQYADGTKATLDQEASDIVEFLAWASEPHLEARNRTGIRVILFLLAMAGLMYAVKRQVWADKH
ncbi:MAG: cytochrome c1 [Proteobacteria bacterium]|nr:cytochrome c1 [Pseudomonadota bacterium]